MPNASSYPRGNAQVGDPAWYRPNPYLQWQKKCEVIAVGIPNEFGHALNILLRTETSGDVEVPPFPPFRLKFSEPKPQVLLFAAEYPAALSQVLHRYHNLVAVRDGGNQDRERFKLLCLACDEWVYIGQTCIESCELRYYVDLAAFQSSDPEVDESGSELVCGCPSLAYDFPYFDYGGDLCNEEEKG